MAFAQLTYRESLRDIKACLGSMQSKLYYRPSVAGATEGAAPNSPAKLFGLSTSPVSANTDTTAPPTRNRMSIWISGHRIPDFTNSRAWPGPSIPSTLDCSPERLW
jgi:hypothetical protein